MGEEDPPVNQLIDGALEVHRESRDGILAVDDPRSQ